MNITNDTIRILENFCEINNSLYFKPGNTLETMNVSKSHFAKAIVPDTFPQEFAIADLKRFLSALSLFENPSLDFKENWVDINEQGKSLQYVFADEKVVLKAKSIAFPETDIKFPLKGDILKEVLKFRNVLSLPFVVFKGDKKHIYFGTEDPSNPTTDKYYTLVGKTNKQFKAVIKTDNLKLLPGDYEVHISEDGISEYVGNNVTFWSALNETSKFGEKND